MSQIFPVIQSLNLLGKFCLWVLMIAIIMSVAISFCQLPVFVIWKKANTKCGYILHNIVRNYFEVQVSWNLMILLFMM